MSNKPKATAEEITSPLTPQVVAQAGQAAQELQTLTTAFSDAERETNFRIGQRIGRKSVIDAFKKLGAITDILDLQRIKEAKEFKGLRVNVAGKLVTISTWEDYCVHVEGRSRESIDLDLKNLEVLGADFFDATRQLGIGPATMRSLRRLPDDQKDALLEIANTGDKDIFLQTIDDLSAKHAKEKEATTKAHAAALGKAEAELVASQRALDASSATITNLHLQLGGEYEPRPGSVAKTALEEALLEEIGRNTLDCGQAMRQMFLTADKAFESAASEEVKLMARQAVEFLCQQLADIALEFNVKVNFEQALNPPWLSEAMAADIDSHIADAEAKTVQKALAKAATKAAGKPKLSAV